MITSAKCMALSRPMRVALEALSFGPAPLLPARGGYVARTGDHIVSKTIDALARRELAGIRSRSRTAHLTKRGRSLVREVRSGANG